MFWCFTYTHISRETFGSVAGKLTDNLEVVELGLEPSQELLAGGHEVGVELEEVANQLPKLLDKLMVKIFLLWCCYHLSLLLYDKHYLETLSIKIFLLREKKKISYLFLHWLSKTSRHKPLKTAALLFNTFYRNLQRNYLQTFYLGPSPIFYFSFNLKLSIMTNAPSHNFMFTR